MNVLRQIKYGLIKHGVLIERTVDSDSIHFFLKRFREHLVSVDLNRVGGDGDGGYLVPNILDEITYCFSPGVNYTANFERELSQSHNIKSYMADASVDSAPFDDPNFFFIKKFLGNRNDGEILTLGSWVDSNVDDHDAKLLLQMDIEGAEYDVLTFEPIEFLKRFTCMIVEFHSVDEVFNKNFLRMFSSIFEKLYEHFSICHVHPNNCCPVASHDGIRIPSVFEVTFLRNDYVEKLKNNNKIFLPHKLDQKNSKEYKDIEMPVEWWRC